ncbi:hypothetical protein C6503_02920 [Candidatus Poribacteria bacterium]|nr:MAG: hypothetical protein C6503_02920 [Candidatus Poribacteria bacterium]
MKICRLKLKNLNSFRTPVDIDFENPPLDDASLVAITGPTGAGKTTLLDAISVALYGKTPRLSGSTSQHPRHLISHGEKEAFAEVLFMANGTRYLATWSVRQKGAPKVQLFYADDGKLISDRLSKKGKSLSTDQKTVSEEVESILGLDFDAFTRSVMLAQGEFAAFLKADKENRRNILEATAGVHIYDILREELNRKVAEVKAAYDEVIDELKGIPEASPDQLKNAEAELDRQKQDAKRLGEEIQQTQEEKARETKRTEDFEKLQSSEKRRKELLAQQPEIDAVQEELENAHRAQRLLSEKREFDTAQAECEESEEAFRSATTEKAEAETQVETNRAAYEEKAEAYQAASTERDEKMPVFAAAKSDVERAAERYAEADKRTPELVDVNNQVDELENQLTDRQSQQSELQKEIDDAEHFLGDNSLPSDRQQRLTKATGLLAELGSHEKQLETELKDKANAEKKVSSLSKEIEKLSKTQEERLSEKASAETTLEDATTQLNKLLTTGTHEEWTARKQQVAKAYPILQGYQDVVKNMNDLSEKISELNDTVSTLNVELVQIKGKMREQTKVCQHTAEAVEKCESALRSAMLASHVNQLRHHLHEGEPCPVCGAMEHPFAGVVEPEGEDLLQDAETALANARHDAQAAQEQMQFFKIKQMQAEQNKRNVVNQMSEFGSQIEGIREDNEVLSGQLNQLEVHIDGKISISNGKISMDEGFASETGIGDETEEVLNISLDLIVEQITEADIAIAALGEADQVRTEASHAYEMVSQQLETSEKNIKRETNDLNAAERQLENLNNTITDLQADIKATETRFWESMPETFHGITPKEAVDQFEDKIETVASREVELGKAEADIRVLKASIEADEGTLQNLKESREALKNEKDQYLREQEAFLSAAREKTGGLETENEINKAIRTLEIDLQTKEDASDDAEAQLQKSQNLLTQKQAAHDFCEKQLNTSGEKLDASREGYFNKLKKEGFDAPEAHDDAFRDDDQIQGLTERIDAYQEAVRDLVSDIRELSARFDEKPFEPEALGRIEVELSEIEMLLQEKQQEVGAQQKKIDDLKEALERREALGDELRTAQHALERWQRLQATIPANALRDFALEIMFRQMGNLANEQLKYLTSDRYQLKVETIGDLSVIDRWNANEERPVETLSGGESFLTSLALALALSELSSGRAQLNSLFLDEGFGTLDAETLDIAIAALEGLRMQGRNIFLISHIRELTRRLPVKIEVDKKGNGSSSVKIQG